MKKQKKHYRQRGAALVLALTLLTGCTGGRPQEGDAQMQADFDAFTQELFLQQLEDITINTHFLLKNPENYG